jgi:hypothetical protein
VLWGCLRATDCCRAVTGQRTVMGLHQATGREAREGQHRSFGPRPSAFGPRSPAFGQRPSAFGPRPTAFGPRPAAFGLRPSASDRSNHRCPTPNNTSINRAVTTCAALVTNNHSPTYQRMHRQHLHPQPTNINHSHPDQPPELFPETVPQASPRSARRGSHS